MKRIFFIFACLLSINTFAQDSITQPTWVIGVESNFLFHDQEAVRERFANNNFRYGYGIHLEKPLGQWGIHLGVLRQEFGPQRNIDFTGEILPPQDADDEPAYVYNLSTQQLSYWSFPLRLQYRLPCNCIYAQASILTNLKTSQVIGNHRRIETNEEPNQLIRNVNELANWSLGYSLDAGFNLYFTDQLKLFSRLSLINYGFTNNKLAGNFRMSNNYLSLSLGLQYAIHQK